MNNRLKYTDFVEEVRRSLAGRLGCELKQVVFEQRMSGIDGENDRLNILNFDDGRVKGCSVHIRRLYLDAVMMDKSIPEVINVILEQIEQAEDIGELPELQRMDFFYEYERAREFLFVRLFELERFEDELQGKVYIQIGRRVLYSVVKVQDYIAKIAI